MTQEFIEQTARDYDLPVHIVESIMNKYPDTYYEELEILLKKNTIKIEY